jgi:hypothetical protein
MIDSDIATAYNTSTDSLPSAESSQHGPAGGFVIPQPIKYIIIAGVGLAVFLAGLTIWSCIQKRNRRELLLTESLYHDSAAVSNFLRIMM